MSELMEKLREKEQKMTYSTTYWRPSEGDVIEGVVTDRGETITENGDAEYIQIDTEKGRFMVFLNSVLRHQLEAEGVQKGDTIAIKFLGLVQSKRSRRKYKKYLVAKGDKVA